MTFMLLRSKNISATEYYYNIIRSALDRCGTVLWDGMEGEPMPDHKDAILVVGSCTSMLRMWRKGYRNIITWFQGVLPEESYMRNHSQLRKIALSWIEHFALKRSRFPIFVSYAMKQHYEKKYHLNFDSFHVMPCFNTEYQMAAVSKKNYSHNVFAYIGGLSRWQCIGQTLELYRRVELKFGECVSLLILTSQQEEAKSLIKQYGIQNAAVSFVHYSRLPEVLQTVKFGFALREENTVNNVSTPTKLANYVANGVIPIYTKAVKDFQNESKNNPLSLCLCNVNSISEDEMAKLQHLIDDDINKETAEKCFSAYFKEYYNSEWHANQLSKQIERLKP